MLNKLIITGGNGFLATSLGRYFTDKSKEIILLARHPGTLKNRNVRYVHWDGKNQGSWCSELEGADAIINLAGRSVDCRYTEKNKKEIYASRLDSTRVIGESLRLCAKPPKLWMNASSATIYRASYDKLMTEQHGEIGDDFSMDVCKQWENTFNHYVIPGVRKIALRTAITLGRDGGAMTPLRNLARAGLGGSHGNGNQFMSWIHIHDFCHVVDWMLENTSANGVYNVAAPRPLPNKDFMKTLRENIGVAFGMNLPAWLLTAGAIFIRTEPELILKSRKVYPKRLLDEGFVFEFNDVKSAMEDLYDRKKRR